jgi:hypothetical protein
MKTLFFQEKTENHFCFFFMCLKFFFLNFRIYQLIFTNFFFFNYLFDTSFFFFPFFYSRVICHENLKNIDYNFSKKYHREKERGKKKEKKN